MRKIRFEFGSIALEAELLQTQTADAIWNKLPINGEVLRWGEEVYFEIPVAMKREPGARAVVEAGEIAYWPDGNSIAIGFGRASEGRNADRSSRKGAREWAWRSRVWPSLFSARKSTAGAESS